jgi:sirohydrochlorin ferrochelatase
MRAIIVLGHGSRMPESGKDMELVVAELKRKFPQEPVEHCYLTRPGVLFPEIFEKCVGQGAVEVLVLPYFLHFGRHLSEDIPMMLLERAKAFPSVKIILGRHLGFDPLLADLLEKRVLESAGFPDIRKQPTPKE